jgi:hypothetical protein
VAIAVARGRAARDAGYELRKERARAREASQSSLGRDIGRIPPIANPDRRRRAGESLRCFIETYLTPLFTVPKTGEHWPWSRDQLTTMQRIGAAVREGGLFAVAMPRSGAKSSLIKAGALYAILYGYRRWVCVLAATMPKAMAIIADIQMILETNPLLAQDFPESVYPIQRLERITNRQRGQTCLGRPTRIVWNADRIALPDIPGSPAAGALVTCTGLDGAGIRGQVRAMPDGTQLRPDLALIDDPQTDESAKSEYQTAERVSLLAAGGAVMEMGPPGQPIAGLMAVTVIRENDMADQILRDPAWNAVRQPMLVSYPIHRAATPADVAHGDWWDKYAELMRDRRDDEARALYGAHRCKPECLAILDERRPCGTCPLRPGCMDAEAIVSWLHRKYADDLSAIEHAMRRWIKNPTSFAAEMQQAPLPSMKWGAKVTPAQVAERWSGLGRGRVPAECDMVTGAIDVHDEILYWVVAAWKKEDFTGQVIDYGTYPEQPSAWFEQASPPRPMSRQFPGAGKEGVILQGLERLVTLLLKHEWPRTLSGSTATFQVEKLFVDSGYKPKIVEQVRRRLATPVIQASRGIGIMPMAKPVSEYQKRPGWVIGDNWFIPSVRGTREYPHLRIDTNWWKTVVHNALATSVGDPGALTIWGSPATRDDHAHWAEHVAGSEYFVETAGRGRVVNVWKEMPKRQDNHWFDCLVSTAAAASVMGARHPAEAEGETEPARKKYTQADIRRRQTS